MYSKKHLYDENIDYINEAIKENRPITEIARHIGVKLYTIRRWLDEHGVEYKCNQNRKGLRHWESRRPMEDYFSNKVRIDVPTLRKRLIEYGYKEVKCECCGADSWMGKPIPLELHHKNGNHYDNTLENLEMLCRNCHGVKHNYGADQSVYKSKKEKPKVVKERKPKREKKIYLCERCGVVLTSGKSKTGLCQACLHKLSRVAERPSREELIELLCKYSYVDLSKRYGVSDNAIRKWLKSYNVTTQDIRNIRVSRGIRVPYCTRV